MGTATIRVSANTEQAKRGIKELGKDLDSLNKKRLADQERGKQIARIMRQREAAADQERGKQIARIMRQREAAADQERGKRITQIVHQRPGSESAIPHGAGIASPLAGFGKEILKVTGLIGGLSVALEAIKNVDFIKNGLTELKSYIDGFSNPGEGVGESLDWHGKWADKGRQYRMSALDAYSSENAARIAFGTDKGPQMIEKADTYVSEALSGTSPDKSKTLVKDMGFSVNDALAMQDMSAEERFMTIMKKAAGMKNRDEAVAALSSILGAKSAGDAKAALSELPAYERMKKQIRDKAEPVLNANQMQFNERAGDDMDMRRIDTELERNKISSHQVYSGFMDEESRRAAAENFNSGANARENASEFMWRKNISDGYFQQSGYTMPENMPPPSPFDEGEPCPSPFEPTYQQGPPGTFFLNREDYNAGVTQIVGAIATASQPPATNDRPPARFA